MAPNGRFRFSLCRLPRRPSGDGYGMGWQAPATQVAPAAQSVSTAQLVRQAATPSQAKGAQSWVAPATHCPLPSQVEASVSVELISDVAESSGQVAAPQDVPASTGAQVPAWPATLQAWQVPQLALPQQTPSTQLSPVRHSPAAAQASPRCRLSAHLLVAGSQMPCAQSVSVAQVVLQVVPLHL
jgi:hypothetical protein